MVLQARNFSRPKRLRVATFSMQNSVPSSLPFAPTPAGKSSIDVTTSHKTVTQTLTSSLMSAARRRRARANGTIHAPWFAVSDAKRKTALSGTSSKKASRVPKANKPVERDASEDRFGIDVPVPDVEMVDVEHSSSPQSSTPKRNIQMKTVQLPRYLPRPPSSHTEVDVEALVALQPDLKGVDVGFVRDGLAELGPGMLRVLTSVVANSTRDVLPTELSVLVRDLSSDLPTHMLAIYGTASSPGASTLGKHPKRRVTLYAVHSLVLSALCSNLPKGLFKAKESSNNSSSSTSEPATNSSSSENGQCRMTLPVVPLCLPDPNSFAQLAAYLYTRHRPTLVRSLLPPVRSADSTSTIPQSVSGHDNTSDESDESLYELDSDSDEEDVDSENSLDSISTSKAMTESSSKAEQLSVKVYVSQLSNLPTTTLLTHAMLVHGLWRNAGVLGVSEHGLWASIARCWGVLVDALEEQILRDKINHEQDRS